MIPFVKPRTARLLQSLVGLAICACGASRAEKTAATPARSDSRPTVRVDTLPTRSALGRTNHGRIRLGPDRLEAGTRPLLVVDGTVVGRLPVLEEPNSLRADSSAAGRWVAATPVADIVSLSILKRRLAVEAYGEAAADGALLVETRRARPANSP